MAINKYKDFECDRCHRVFTKIDDDWLRKHTNQLKLVEGDRDTGLKNVVCNYDVCYQCLKDILFVYIKNWR